jgi:NADH:ubiquinone oxidoreductase subunit 6 (subunit J)
VLTGTLLKGAVLVPITSPGLVILIYIVLALMLVAALTTVLVRDLFFSVGAFAATLLLVAILYLAMAPFALFAVQLVIFAGVSALIVVWLLRDTTGLERQRVGPFSREWIIGGGVAAAVLALIALVVGVTAWPAGCCAPSLVTGFGDSVTNSYVVGLATTVIVLASGAVGASLVLRRIPRTRPSAAAGTRRQGR